MKSALIIGAGQFGTHIAKRMEEMRCEVMVVDINEECINDIMDYVTNAQIGDGTNEEFLRTLGIDNFDVCFVTLGRHFQTSLETTSLLSELGAKRVVSRATNDVQMKFLLRNGASYVVFPERELGFWTAIRFSSDSISNYVDLSDGYGVYEIKVPARWSGLRIDELDVRRKFHVNILGVRDCSGSKEISAGSSGRKKPLPAINMDIRNDTVLQSGQTMMVLTKPEYLHRII